MNEDERLEELIQAYAREEASAEQLAELARRLEAGDERLAARLPEAQFVAGWFRSEADPGFVDETSAAVRTVPDDSEFLSRTLQRIERRRRTRRRAATADPNSPWTLLRVAAGMLLGFGLLLWSSLSQPAPRTPAPLPVALPQRFELPVEPPPPPPAPVLQPDPLPAPPQKPSEPPSRPELPRPELPPLPPPLPPPAPRKTVAAIARVEGIEGEVTIDGRPPARADIDLPPGKGLETTTGRAQVRFPDGTTVEIGPATTIAEVADEGGKRIRLQTGSLAAVVSKQPEGRPFVITTPHGEARVVGTTLRVSADERAGTRLEVTEGKVRLTRLADRKSVEVVTGHFALIASGAELVSRPIEGFTIRDIPSQGLALWLRADSGITAGGGAVSSWSDQSPHRRDAVQQNPTKRPLLIVDAVRGRPALRFDGADDGLVAPLPVEGLGGLTLAIVSANAVDCSGGTAHGDNAALFWPESVPWGWVYLSPFRSNVKFRFGTTQPDNLPFHIRPASTEGAFTLTLSVKDGPVESLYLQGILAERVTGKAFAVKGTIPTFQIGFGAQGKGFPGDIAEVLVYTRSLSDADRQRLERALIGKYFGNR